MPETTPGIHDRFGQDLRLLARLEVQETRDRDRDLLTVTTRRVKRPGLAEPKTLVDLDRLEGVENLQQALLLRFLTEKGELAPLGHRDYGSRLGELIGELNTETTRNRAKLYALETLEAEPRVAEVLSVEVTTRRSEPTRIDIRMRLRTLDSDTILNLVFPFYLGGGGS